MLHCIRCICKRCYEPEILRLSYSLAQYFMEWLDQKCMFVVVALVLPWVSAFFPWNSPSSTEIAQGLKQAGKFNYVFLLFLRCWTRLGMHLRWQEAGRDFLF